MTTATSTSETSNKFVNRVRSLNETYDTDESTRATWLTEFRESANEHFLKSLLSSDQAVDDFETNVQDSAKLGKKTVQLTSWTGRGPTHKNQSLSDLLDVGDLVQRMQDFLDLRYGEKQFMVFNHNISSKHGQRTTALTVSWNPEGFENAEGILETNRQRAVQRMERTRLRNDGDYEHHEGGTDQPRQQRQYRDNRGGPRDQAPRQRYQNQSRGQQMPRRRYEDRDQSQSHVANDVQQQGATGVTSARRPAKLVQQSQ